MRKYIPSLSKAILSRNNHFSIASDLYNENVIPEMIYSSMHTMDEPELIKVCGEELRLTFLYAFLSLPRPSHPPFLPPSLPPSLR